MSDNNPRPLGWLGPWCLLVGVVLLVTGLFLPSAVLNWLPRGVGTFSLPGFSRCSLQFSFPPQILCRRAVCSGVSWHPDLGIFRCRTRLLAAGFPINGTRRADGAGSSHRLHCVSVKENRPPRKGRWRSARSLLSAWASPLFRCFNPIRPCRLAAKSARWCR